MSTSEMIELARLREENAMLKARAASKFKIQESEKGGIMITGMRKFPVTFYADEWEKLFGLTDQIRAFARSNATTLMERQARAKDAREAL